VGLASFLLGIKTPEQAARDPLRGGLYENYIILEMMKSRLNRGLRPEFYFYRDSNGNEVDLLIREQGLLYPVEIKSSATFSQDFLKGIDHFYRLGLKRLGPGTIIYNGDQHLQVKGTLILNPFKMGPDWNFSHIPVLSTQDRRADFLNPI
jgi:predicted AAA+ superfamily ATPase